MTAIAKTIDESSRKRSHQELDGKSRNGPANRRINKDPAGIGLYDNNRIGLPFIYSITPYTQSTTRHTQHNHRKMVCRNFVVRKQLVTTNIASPDIMKSVITLKVVNRFSLKRMLRIAKITRIETNRNSFLRFLKLIHSGVFQINNSNNGIKQAIKIGTLFHGYGQVCTEEVEKKIINIVDTQ